MGLIRLADNRSRLDELLCKVWEISQGYDGE